MERTYSFEDMHGGVLDLDLGVIAERPWHVSFTYRDKEGKLWRVEGECTRAAVDQEGVND